MNVSVQIYGAIDPFYAKSDLKGLAGKYFSFHRLGVSDSTSLAGCRLTRCKHIHQIGIGVNVL